MPRLEADTQNSHSEITSEVDFIVLSWPVVSIDIATSVWVFYLGMPLMHCQCLVMPIVPSHCDVVYFGCLRMNGEVKMKDLR